MEFKNVVWKRVNHGLIREPLVDYLKKIIIEQKELGVDLKICVGTDSQKKGKGFQYAIAIIIEMRENMGKDKLGKPIYKGLGAKVISGTYHEKFYGNNRPSLKQRMLNEVQMSIDTCYNILPLIEDYNVDMEIHADVNPNPRWGSNVALVDAIGFIKGMNFNYKVKPHAYAASSGADKLCNS